MTCRDPSARPPLPPQPGLVNTPDNSTSYLSLPSPPHLRIQSEQTCILSASISVQSHIPNWTTNPKTRSSMSSNVLSARDANAQVVKSSPEKKEEKPKTLDYQRQMLNKRLNGNK